MKKLSVVITLLLVGGCTVSEPLPNKIEFKSICGASRTLVCLPQHRECWCQDPLELQKMNDNEGEPTWLALN
jgi:hypothetical protein